jgi:hypothetical protein
VKLELKRRWLTPKFTIGELFVDGVFECFIGEDRYRPPPQPKVYGKTAIPCGTYEVRVTHSPRFQRFLPLLLKVPGFEGVRIHPGNVAADTEGCLLPGRSRRDDQVLESRLAFDALHAKVMRAQMARQPISITITVEPAP